jgi:MarR family transcriptional regulator, lower aerobic nicotinate degradation pathway regulator
VASLPVVNQPVHRSGALLDYLARRIRLRAESVLAPMGLRPRHMVTLTVLRQRGGCSQQALATMLEMDGTNVVGLLNDLESEGLIERRRSPQDRRRHVVELTDKGGEVLAKAECVTAAVEDEVLSALDETQREALYTLLFQAAAGADTLCTERGGAAGAAAVCAGDDAGGGC